MVKNSKRILLTAALIIMVILDVIVTVHVSENLLDDDTSGDMMLSKCMYDERSLICSDWDYAIEIRIPNQAVFAPFFGIFSDWTSVRIAGTLIIQLIFMLSAAFMLRSAGLRTESILFGCILFLLPYCVSYGRIVLYHTYYAFYISHTFLIIGAFFRASEKPDNGFLAAVTAALCLTGCLYGIRVAFISIAPLCIIAFRILLRKKKEAEKLFRLALFCGLSGIAGLLLNSFVLTKFFRLNTTLDYNLAFKGLSEARTIFFAILRQFSVRSGIEKGGFLYVMSMAGILTACYTVFMSGKAFFTEKDDKKVILKGMLFVLLVLNTVVYLFYRLPYNYIYDYSRYLVPASVWIIPLLCAVFDEDRTGFRKVSFAAAMLIFSCNGLMNLAFFQNPDHFTQEYDGLFMQNTKSVTRYEGAARFIRENGYELGYAFGDSNVLTEYMNGFPVARIKNLRVRFIYEHWLTHRNYREIKAGKAFLLTDTAHWNVFQSLPASEGCELVYKEGNRILLIDLADPEAFKESLGK